MNMMCMDYQFEMNKKHKHPGKVELCKCGFHFCANVYNIHLYYNFEKSRLFIIEYGEITSHDYESLKGVTDEITFLVEITAHNLSDLYCSKIYRDLLMQNHKGLLLFFCASGQLSAIEFLLSQRASVVNIAFALACRNGHLSVVKFLVDNGADIHAKDNLPIQWACERGHYGIVKYLYEKGADIHVNNGAPLRSAISFGHRDVAAFLTSKNVVIKNDE